MNCFSASDILLPQVKSLEKWAVIACDQFTSEPIYWDRVRKLAKGVPSAYHLILPEAELGTPREFEHIREIHETMEQYLSDNLFRTYPHSYIYIERTLENGSIRRGLLGMIDLEDYDYTPGSSSPIRSTERTVMERIPPRQQIRRYASIELPHVLLLCDDFEHRLIEPIGAQKDRLPKLYDFELMLGGGRIAGWLVSGRAAEEFDSILTDYTAHIGEKYEGIPGVPMVLAVGDGNHSLATAKTFYEKLKSANPGKDFSGHPARYALAELENIHDPAQVFEPIHRVIFKTEPRKLLEALEAECCASDGYEVQWYIGKDHGTIYLDRAKGTLAVGILQNFLDDYLENNDGRIDYIHDDEVLIGLADHDDTIGFLLPAMEKRQLFPSVIADGALPRKTFSMGHSREKRYYLEARMIQK